MRLANEIRREIARYVAGQSDVTDLWTWVQDNLWDVDNRDPLSAPLAHEVELLLSETAHGDWTEAELRERLTPLASLYEFAADATLLIRTSAGSVRTLFILQPA